MCISDASTILKRRILTGEYISGEKLPPERILSKNLGASRGILREALKAIVATGYLTIVRGRIGGYVITKAAGKTAFDAAVSATNMNRENVLVDGLEFRRMFEPKICRAAAKNRTDINIVNLERFAEECERIENNSVLSYRTYFQHPFLSRSGNFLIWYISGLTGHNILILL